MPASCRSARWEERSRATSSWASIDVDTGEAGVECANAGDVCNATDTEPGNMSGPFNDGIETLLSDTAGADCVEDDTFNCDSMEQVLGGSAETLSSAFGGATPANFPNGFTKPAGWIDELYGAYDDAKHDQYWYDGDDIKCDSPRLATVPIVAHNDNWDLGGTATNWPNGSNKRMKIVGFYTVYISEPNELSDFDSGGNGNGNGLDEVEGTVVWFGPNAMCEDGSAFAPLGTLDMPEGVKLISG